MTEPINVATPTDQEILVSRLFDAAPSLVFDCHTKPDLVRRWLLGPPGWTMPVCEIDLRVGGRYRYRWRSEAGDREFGTTGEFRTVDAPHAWSHTEQMDGRPGELLCVNTLSDEGGRARLTMRLCFDSQAERDAALQSGMTRGMGISFDRLADILAQ